jgi:hypothetical protein
MKRARSGEIGGRVDVIKRAAVRIESVEFVWHDQAHSQCRMIG